MQLKTDQLIKPRARSSDAFSNQQSQGKGLSRNSVPVLQQTRKYPQVVQRTETRALPLVGGEEKGEVKMGDIVQVGGNQGTWLEKGSQVIALIKMILLPYGSGNVEQSIEGSQSQSLTRLTAFRNMSYLDPEMKEKPVTVGTLQMGDLKDPKLIIQSAVSAAVVQGGNCLQNGEIAFALLNLMLDGGTPIALVQPGGCDHAFTVIGNVPVDGPVTKEMAKQLVCVDAWPHVAKACLLSDSYFGTWEKAHVVPGLALGGGKATPFFDEVEKQKKLVHSFSQSMEPKDRDVRSQRNNLRTAMKVIREHTDRKPGKQDFEGAYGQMTIFENDIVPQYITPSHPAYDPDL